MPNQGSRAPDSLHFRRKPPAPIMSESKLCITCGHVGPSKRETRGSFIVEVFLWFIFLLPGIVYSLWRHATRYDACPECGAANMIPATSPVARKLMRLIASDDPHHLSDAECHHPQAENIG